MNNIILNKLQDKTEVSRRHFHDEGERIKAQDKQAIYEIRDPKNLAIEDDFGFIRYDTILNLVDKYIPQSGKSHLDLGCGLGYLMAKMAQRGFKTSGVDIAKSFLDIAKQKLEHWRLPYEQLIEADLQKEINLSDASFDLITSTDVLEHIEKPKLFLRQIHRLLKPDGIALVSTNNLLSLWGLEKTIKERFFLQKCFHPIDHWSTFFSFKRMVEASGFKVLEVRGAYFLPLYRFQRFYSIFGIYKKRYEINEWFSRSPFRYFGRDIILVFEKNRRARLCAD